MNLWAILGASLVGSLHCAGMCGPLAAIAAGHPRHQVAYNLGRLVSYAALGAIAGTLGSVMDLAGATLGLSKIASVVAGFTMISYALMSLSKRWHMKVLPRACGRPFFRLTRHLEGKPIDVRAPLLGLLTGILPCGWLYAFVAVAAGSAAPVSGMLVMAAFWLGTVPAMLTVGTFARHLRALVQRRFPELAAVVLLALGLGALFQRPLSLAALTPESAKPQDAHGENAPCH
ncbi:MAG: hypothetical protein RJA70_1283 [Pseudomonadota bacterium]|jgi:sulfite exporter TauE/SafE